ncbi:MAG: hemerythrin domain-containing protein [Bacteroidales bacterium]|nr:hemerythrin domain-containing protein [Bacteroidales bacterium]
MKPTTDIKGEHYAITIILGAMKKLAHDMRIGKFIDSYRIVQILDFLHTFSERCHTEKEEKCLFPALLEYDIPWTADTINQLTDEHKLAHDYLNEIDTLFDEYLSGNAQVLKSLSASMMNYVVIEERHIKIVDNVLLPLCDKVFDTEKLKFVVADLKKIQDQNVGHIKHLEYYKFLTLLYTENDVVSESVYY